MARTQFYLEQEAVERLRSLSKQRGLTVSALVREAIEKAYPRHNKPQDWEARFDRAVGAWKRPSEEPEPEELVRRMRR